MRASGGFAGPDLPGRGQPVHFRHHHIHQDQIVLCQRQGGDRLGAVADGVGVMAEPFQQTQGNQAVGRVVLRHQDPQPRRRRRFGSAPPGPASAGGLAASCSITSKRNVLPTPGWLSTAIAPPISSTSRRQIARPSPLPPKRREIEPSIWVNSSNMRSIARQPMPMPLSATQNSSRA